MSTLEVISRWVPYLFYVGVGIMVTWTCAVIAARRKKEKTPGEAMLAAQEVLPSREVGPARALVGACYVVLRESEPKSVVAIFALAHVLLWIVLGVLIVAMGMVALVKQFS